MPNLDSTIQHLKIYILNCGFSYYEELNCYVNKNKFYEIRIDKQILRKGILRKGKINPIAKVYKKQYSLKRIKLTEPKLWSDNKLWFVDENGNRIIPKCECSQTSFNLKLINKFLLVQSIK